MSAVALAVLHAAAALLGSALADQFQERTFAYKSADGASRTVAYRLLAPPRLLPGEKYPLVIFLHGKGNRGNDNTSQLDVFPDWMASAEMRKRYPCFLLAPQCPGDRDWSPRWWDKRQPPPSDPDEPLVQVVGMMDEIIKTKPIDQHRVYLTGLSMGGFGSWELAADFRSGSRQWRRWAAAAIRTMRTGSQICPSGAFTATRTIRYPSNFRGT